MATKILMTDGYKTVNMPMDFDSDIGWQQIGGGGVAIKDAQLYARVAAVFRAAQMSADAIASVPFAVFRGDEEIDSSANWRNAVGFMPSPKNILRLWRLSLFMTNSAYGYIDSVRGVRGRSNYLRYIMPSTITIDADENGISAFTRRIGDRDVRWREDDPRLFYAHRLDWDTELLPSANTEFTACSNAAGIMYAADVYIRRFFERQGILPTMLLVKGVPQKTERENLEKFFDRLMRGLTRTVGKVLNAEMIDVKQIGVGVDSLKDNAQYRQSIENVAMALNIPLSLILSNSANYSTAQMERESWYRDSVIPYAELMAEAINARLFAPRGYRFEFIPEAGTVAQDEEERRATAARTYYEMLRDGGYPEPLGLAMRIMGVDLPSGVEYEQLDNSPQPEQEPGTTAEAPETLPAEELAAARKSAWTFDEFEELKIWRDKSLRAVKAGRDLPLAFDNRVLDDATTTSIRDALAGAKSEADVIAVFDHAIDAEASDALVLAAAINRLAEHTKGETHDTPDLQTGHRTTGETAEVAAPAPADEETDACSETAAASNQADGAPG